MILSGCLTSGGEDADVPNGDSPGDDTSNSPPSISGTPSPSVETGTEYNFIPVAVDPDGDALMFSINNKPDWASFDAGNGQVFGMPMPGNEGTYSDIEISVSDGEHSTALMFAITVRQPDDNPGSSAPTIAGNPPQTVVAGQEYLFVPEANDPDGDALSFAISNRPSWAAFDTASGRLAGTPKEDDTGTYTGIEVSVSDGAQGAAIRFNIDVLPASTPPSNTAPSISGTPDPTVKVGSAFSFTPMASDVDGDTLTFTVANKPNWASFAQSTGRLSGTPTAGAEGNYLNIRITVSDGAANDSLEFDISVLPMDDPDPQNTAPRISGSPPNSVVVGQPYSFVPTATDADGDQLSFSVTNKPGWANFNATSGELSGTPPQGSEGSYDNIRIMVSDGAATDSMEFGVTVVAAANSSVSLRWTAPSENEDGSTLTDLAGYEIHYGLSSGNYNNTQIVANPSVSSAVVENLAPGAYFFSTKSYNSSGIRSSFSGEIRVQVN